MNIQDSPLSITASVAGILTFAVAIAAAAYARVTYLRSADKEFFQVKASLTWYKTESTWMYDLVNVTDSRKRSNDSEKEYQMYIFVMDQLQKLEERLLSLLTQAELEANKQAPRFNSTESWTIIPQKYRTFQWLTATTMAVSWLPVRAKALELVRQRDALGPRVQFAQLSMISSRVLDQEARAVKLEEQQWEWLNGLEDLVCQQNEKIGRLEKVLHKLTGPLPHDRLNHCSRSELESDSTLSVSVNSPVSLTVLNSQ